MEFVTYFPKAEKSELANNHKQRGVSEHDQASASNLVSVSQVRAACPHTGSLQGTGSKWGISSHISQAVTTEHSTATSDYPFMLLGTVLSSQFCNTSAAPVNRKTGSVKMHTLLTWMETRYRSELIALRNTRFDTKMMLESNTVTQFLRAESITTTTFALSY